MKKGFKISIALAAVFAIVAGAAYITKASSVMGTGSKYIPPISGTKLDQYTSHPNRRLVIVTVQGTIKCQLFENLAPNHVAQFIMLANQHFFDSTYFHRVIPGFMIQGGDPNTKDNDYSNDGMGGYSQRLMAEFSPVHHARGILSTARQSGDANSATSQFFIMQADYPSLDNQYTVWGQVTDGMDVVDKIVNLPDVSGVPGGTNPGRAAMILQMYVQN